MRRDLEGLFALGMDSINRDIHRFWGEGIQKFSFNIFSMISHFPNCKDARLHLECAAFLLQYRHPRTS